MTDILPPHRDNFERQPRVQRRDQYIYQHFFEKDSEPLTWLARQVHAASYRGEGFINEMAIDEDGAMVSDLDKARGELTEIYLGLDSATEAHFPVSTLRKVRISAQGSIDELPGYRIGRDYLYPEEKKYLLELPPQRIREIAAFGHVPEVGPVAGLELLRDAMQDSVGTGEVWYFTMVSKKYDSLVSRFGPKAVRRVGEAIPLEDPRVEDITLVPAVVDTDTFFQNILDTILEETVPAKRRRYIGTLVHFTEGMDRALIGQEVKAFLDQIRDEARGSFDFMPLLESSKESAEPKWSPPVEFDLRNADDRRRLSIAFEDNAIDPRGVARAPFIEELAEIKYPGEHAENDRREYIREAELEGVQFGRWFMYPWSRRLVQFPEREDYQQLRTARNRNVITAAEQEALLSTQPLIAGLSVGSSVVSQMAHSGTGGSFVLADFDTLAVSNLNRIQAGMHQVGERKIDVAAKKLSELDPYITQIHLERGVSNESLEGLLMPPSILIDEVDDLSAKAVLRMYAKQHKLPLLMVTDAAENTILDIERYDTEDISLFNGRLNDSEVDMILSGELSAKDRKRIIQKLVGLTNVTVTLLDTVQDARVTGFPQPITTVSKGSADLTVVAQDILIGRKVPSGRKVDRSRRRLGLDSKYSARETLDLIRNQISNR